MFCIVAIQPIPPKLSILPKCLSLAWAWPMAGLRVRDTGANRSSEIGTGLRVYPEPASGVTECLGRSCQVERLFCAQLLCPHRDLYPQQNYVGKAVPIGEKKGLSGDYHFLIAPVNRFHAEPEPLYRNWPRHGELTGITVDPVKRPASGVIILSLSVERSMFQFLLPEVGPVGPGCQKPASMAHQGFLLRDFPAGSQSELRRFRTFRTSACLVGGGGGN